MTAIKMNSIEMDTKKAYIKGVFDTVASWSASTTQGKLELNLDEMLVT